VPELPELNKTLGKSRLGESGGRCIARSLTGVVDAFTIASLSLHDRFILQSLYLRAKNSGFPLLRHVFNQVFPEDNVACAPGESH